MRTIISLVGVVVTLANVTFSAETTHDDDKPNTFIINSTSDFINFANSVNNGISYSGTTVYLNSDIYFSWGLSQQFDPIGKDSPNYFQGTFDGQGHIISNLKINSASSRVGLFGYSEGLAIKNIILDGLCSITFSYSGIYDAFVGGIIGECWSKNGACIIENSINKASITFNGIIKNDELNIGGIVGKIYSLSYSIIIKNCANYGSVTHSGESVRSYIGGIVGSSSSYFEHKYIQNCVNYGTITHSGTSKELHMGGITGYSYYTLVENCLSAGKISVSESSLIKFWHFILRYKKFIGSIVGSATSKTSIKYCFWTSDVGFDKISGQGSPSLTETPITSVSTPVAVNKLIAQVTSNSGNKWNKWIYNPIRRKVMFTINGNKHFSISSQAILLPNLVNSNVFKFDGWYIDPGYSKPFAGNEIASIQCLYGLYNKELTVKFDVNGRNIPPEPTRVVILGGTYKELPKPTREGYTFDGWYTDKDGNTKIESGTKVRVDYDHALYAHWVANKYTVTCDVNGGNPLYELNKTVTYDSPYGDLETPIRKGYTFTGWYINNNENISNETIVKTANNHKIYAQWIANKYTVTYDVNDGDGLFNQKREVTYDAPYGDLVEAPIRTGYTFAGWFINVNEIVTCKTIVKAADDHTLHAHWTANKYIVTFNVDGGNISEFTKTVTYDAPYGDLIIPTRKGYKFVRWYVNENVAITNETIVNIASDHTLYAYWTANSYIITFNANGGDDLPESVSTKIVTYDAPYGDLVKAPTRTGYTFTGWYTNKDGGTKINPDSKVETPNNHTLYARWAAVNYIVSFNANGGSISKSTSTVTYDAPYGDLEIPTRKRYAFDGWFADNNKNITSETIVKTASNHEIYAQWTPSKYRITFDENGGDDLPNKTKMVTYDAPYGDLIIPTRKGYTFVRWYVNKNLVTTNETIVNIASDHTLYAQWEDNQMKLTTYVITVAIILFTHVCVQKPKITIIKPSPMKKALLLLCIIKILNFWGQVHEYPF